MAQHFLQGLQIRPVFKQMHRKGMPQGVGGDLPRNTGIRRMLLDDLPEALPGKPAAQMIGEQGAAGGSVLSGGQCFQVPSQP
ncbi:hypothetical protein D3C75_706200 [compost metagenome]